MLLESLNAAIHAVVVLSPTAPDLSHCPITSSKNELALVIPLRMVNTQNTILSNSNPPLINGVHGRKMRNAMELKNPPSNTDVQQAASQDTNTTPSIFP